MNGKRRTLRKTPQQLARTIGRGVIEHPELVGQPRLRCYAAAVRESAGRCMCRALPTRGSCAALIAFAEMSEERRRVALELDPEKQELSQPVPIARLIQAVGVDVPADAREPTVIKNGT